MKIRVPSPLSGACLAVALVFTPFAAGAQNTPMPHGMMGEGMKDEGGMKGCDMMGGGMMDGDMSHMQHMKSMMHEKLSHAGDRIASLKTDLKITEAQTPAWNAFADALLAAAKSMDQSMSTMHEKMQSGAAPSLPEKLGGRTKMATEHLANLNAIKAALDPLYASFNDEQKKLADGLKIGPMGLM